MNGIIPLWKEKGMTSHDCVFKVRKILKMKKVGHGGTLDPEVDGVLPICIGKGTKLLDFLHEKPKTYFGEVTIGFSTTTEDATGEVVEKKDVENVILKEIIDEKIKSYIGIIKQVPPMYSAVKVNGKKLYEYARNGEEVERPVREVEIYNFERTSDIIFDKDNKTCKFSFVVTCSKGTYVRTLAVDLGESLGYPAHMSKLTRIASGGFSVGDAVTLEKLSQLTEEEKIEDALFSLEDVLNSYPKYELKEEEWQKVRNGVHLFGINSGEEYLALWYKDKIVAIYENSKGKYKPFKMLQLEIGD